jgi:hypothetical protein
MAVRGSRGTSSLFTPLYVVDVLIPDEVVQYNERFHWASLVQSLLETISFIILITAFSVGLPGGAFGGFLFILVIPGLVLLWRQGKLGPRNLLMVAAGIVVGFLIFGYRALAVLLIIATFVRFVYLLAMWAFYVKLYITNRRVIRSTGFLGAKIDSMPLTRITDIAFSRSVPGELLGYGTFRLETAGQDQALGRIPFLNQPDLFYNIVTALSTTAQGSVKKPLDAARMAESRAHTVKPSVSRPARVSLRRLWPGTRDFGGSDPFQTDVYDGGFYDDGT